MRKAPRATDEPRLLELVGAIYDAALEPTLWPKALREVGAATGLAMPGIAWGSLQPTLRMNGHQVLECSERWLAAFDERYSQLLSDALASVGPPPSALRVSDFAPVPRVEDWEFWSDWMQPQGLAEGVTAQVRTSEGLLVGIGGYREPRSRPIREREAAVLELLAPHVARAVVLAARLRDVAHERDLFRAALDRLPSAVVLLDGEGRVRAANAGAEALAGQGDGLRLTPQGLCAAERGTQRVLQRLVRQACGAARGDGAGAGGALALPRPSGRRPYELWGCPLPASSARLGGGDGSAAVFLADPEERAEPPEALLRRVHGLTPAEARLAARLATGEALADAADALGVARETARNQLKQVFLKTDTHRQAELVALLLRGAAALAWSPGASEEEERP